MGMELSEPLESMEERKRGQLRTWIRYSDKERLSTSPAFPLVIYLFIYLLLRITFCDTSRTGAFAANRSEFKLLRVTAHIRRPSVNNPGSLSLIKSVKERLD